MKMTLSTLLLLVAIAGRSQQAEIIKLDELKQLLVQPSDKIQVINFWATWCAPCVKEMPLFEQLHAERKDVQVNLVSMDLDLDPNPDKVYRYIAMKKLQSKVYILDAPDPNSWIDQVEEGWSGAIPATLVINTKTGKRKFVARQLKQGELEQMIAGVEN